MDENSSWDFRDNHELCISSEYNKKGYVIKEANLKHLQLIKNEVENAYSDFVNARGRNLDCLENAHKTIQNNESNELRLHIINTLFKNTTIHRNYYNSAKEVIHSLCGNELAIQKRPGISINLPHNENDVLPIHADTWNGVSPYELNIWIPLVNCSETMCLYILDRENYSKRVKDSKNLLRLTSDELFKELEKDLTWIQIKYGEMLAFDQSLPHGYSLNEETATHWSLNCRFKGLHTPYWDKKLGEYFMPITVKNCTRLGMNYKHPENWI